MSATIDYELKEAMPFLAKDNRWNVLTVLILHANVRNRCWPSMETITEMATNGNRTKATRAKKWLERHCAFENVPYKKRVDDELKLSNRQIIYQLLGTIKACNEVGCDCKNTGKIYHYLYLGKQNLNGQTMDTGHNLNGEINENLNGEIFNRLNGETLSITNEVLPVEVIPAVAKSKKKSKPNPDAVFRAEWSQYAAMGNALLAAFGNDFVDADHQTIKALEPYLEVAKELTFAGCIFEEISRLSKYIAARARREEWSKYGVKTFSRYYTDFLKTNRSKIINDDPAMDLSKPVEIVPILMQKTEEAS